MSGTEGTDAPREEGDERAPNSPDAGAGARAGGCPPTFTAETAGNEMHEVLLQGKEMLQQGAAQGAALWQQGADMARDQWQHGAELCQRSMEQGTGLWQRYAPYIDHGIRVTNMAGAVLIGGFVIVGLLLIFTPLKTEKVTHGEFDRMFWVTQGFYLIAGCAPAMIATVQCGVLRSGFADWPAWLKVDLWLSVLKFQLGRALFFIMAGFYVFPLLANFGRMAMIDQWMVYFSYFLGLTSILAGVFLLVFDVVLAVFVKPGSYSVVPQNAEEP